MAKWNWVRPKRRVHKKAISDKEEQHNAYDTHHQLYFSHLLLFLQVQHEVSIVWGCVHLTGAETHVGTGQVVDAHTYWGVSGGRKVYVHVNILVRALQGRNINACFTSFLTCNLLSSDENWSRSYYLFFITSGLYMTYLQKTINSITRSWFIAFWSSFFCIFFPWGYIYL